MLSRQAEGYVSKLQASASFVAVATLNALVVILLSSSRKLFFEKLGRVAARGPHLVEFVQIMLLS